MGWQPVVRKLTAIVKRTVVLEGILIVVEFNCRSFMLVFLQG